MRIHYLYLLIFPTLFGHAQEVEKWSLQKCIDHALQQNINIQQGQIQNQILNNNLYQSKFSRLPNLNGNANHNYNIGRSIDPYTNTFNPQTIQTNSFSLNSGMMLYGGGRINNTIKQNKAALEAGKLGLEAGINQVSLAVASSYLNIIQAEENLKLANTQKELSAQQLERARKLVASGAANQSVAMNLEAQLANDEMQEVLAQNNIRLAYNEMTNLLQLEPGATFSIALPLIDDLPEMPTENVALLYEMALQQMPEVKQAEMNMIQGTYAEKIASANYHPSLSLYGNLNTIYSESGGEILVDGYETRPIGYLPSTNEQVLAPFPNTRFSQTSFGTQLNDNLGQSVGLSLSIPVFNNMRYRTEVQNARLNSQLNKLQVDNVKNQLRTDITTAYTNMQSAKSSYDAAMASEGSQKRNYEFSEKRFEAGMLNSVDLLNAKNMWFQSQIQVLNARYEYIFRILVIDFYKGKEISLNL